MAYCNDFSWNRPVLNGKLTRYMQILIAINNNGPMKKSELMFSIWKITPMKWTLDDTKPYGYGHVECAYSESTLRGHSSKLFACMHENKLIIYNCSTHRWELGFRGIELLEKYKTIIENV